MADPISKQMPADVDEAQRWVPPSPTCLDTEREASGDLPDQPDVPDALDGAGTPYKNLRTGR